MSLTIRKAIVSGTIGIIFITANIMVANWISDTGIADKAGCIRREFLTRTAIYIAAEIPGLAMFVFPCKEKAIRYSGFSPMSILWQYAFDVSLYQQEKLRIKTEWRRGDSNPRPEMLQDKLLHV